MSLKLFSVNLGGGGGSISYPISIANGGTGQTTATLAFNALSPCTTLGDFIYFNGTNCIRAPSNQEVANGNSGTTATIGWSGFQLAQSLILNNSAVSVLFTAPDQVGSPCVLKCINGLSTAPTVTWPTNVDWGSLGAPTLSATFGMVDMFNFYYSVGNTTTSFRYRGSYVTGYAQ